MKIETVPFWETTYAEYWGITKQTLVNLVDMFKFKMNFKSNSSKTSLNCIEINPQPKKIKIRQV